MTGLAARIAERLRTVEWHTDPDRPELHARSRHDRHTFNSDCAICTRDIDRIAALAVQMVGDDIAALLRAAAEGRRDYARTAAAVLGGDTTGHLELQAATIDGCAKVLTGDPGPLYDWLPSWKWTPEMNARLYPERRAEPAVEG